MKGLEQDVKEGGCLIKTRVAAVTCARSSHRHCLFEFVFVQGFIT